MIHAEDKELSPAQQEMIRDTQKELDKIFNEYTCPLTGDEAYEADKNSKMFLKRILGRQVSFDEVVDFQQKLTGSGSSRVFVHEGIYFYKTPGNRVTTVENYAIYLEKTVINNDALVRKAIAHEEYFTSLGFLDLIKLAFNRLFGRN